MIYTLHLVNSKQNWNIFHTQYFQIYNTWTLELIRLNKKLINQYVIQKVDSSNPLWWSYDSILKWPEQLPSWTDGLDSRQTSASSTRNAISTNSNQRPMAAKKHRTPVRRSSKEVRKHID